MSESYREQFPLLCDDLSDEEHYSTHYQRQYHHMKYKGRARSNVKGALAILKRWPEHWSSFLTYWWIGVVMICLMTFILYNSLFAFAVLPTAHFKSIKFQEPSMDTIRYKFQENTDFPNVFIHVFTNDSKEINLKKHLSRIEMKANQYSSYNYHLVVVINDTSTENQEFNAEENNANALNALWTKDIIIKSDETTANNIIIEYISLTQYMDNSPLSKYWRMLSNEIVEFLIRAVSIWDKGGIAFNPIVLMPEISSLGYEKELENIFKTFSHTEAVISSNSHSGTPTNVSHHKLKQNVNNIRDVINALEHENKINFPHDEILAQAESKNIGFVTKAGRKIINKINRNHDRKTVNKRDMYTRQFNNEERVEEKTESMQDMSNKNNASSLNILPLFLEYLYHNSTTNNKDKNTKDIVNHIDSNEEYTKTNDIENKKKSYPTTKKSAKVEKSFNPMIIPANEVNANVKGIKKNGLRKMQYLSKTNKKDQHLTIDIKGNILATETACHAFLGTIFTDAIHYGYEEKLSDFIINELSIFCNGVLSSCSGIELILL